MNALVKSLQKSLRASASWKIRLLIKQFELLCQARLTLSHEPTEANKGAVVAAETAIAETLGSILKI